MAHYAEIDQDNIVLRIIVVGDDKEGLGGTDAEKDEVGSEWCHSFLGGTWKKTSYNNNYRKNFAGIGYTYDEARDAFIAPEPEPITGQLGEWVLNEETCRWEWVED